MALWLDAPQANITKLYKGHSVPADALIRLMVTLITLGQLLSCPKVITVQICTLC